MIPVKASESIQVNKIAILLLATTGTTVGAAPATLFFNRVDSLIFLSVAALIGAIIGILRFESLATEKPSLIEYFLGWLGAIFSGFTTGMVLIGWYFAFLGGATLYALIGSWLGFNIELNVEQIAYTLSLALALVMSFGINAMPRLAAQLYPNIAHVRTEFYELVTFGKSKLVRYLGYSILVLVGLVSSVLLTRATFTVWWFNIGLFLCLGAISLLFTPTRDVIDRERSEAIKAIGKLYSALEYQVIQAPITGKEDLDPLLVGLDYLVQNKEHALAIAVRKPGPSVTSGVRATQPRYYEDPWEPSDLLRSTWALKYFLHEEQHMVDKIVIPVIVSTGKASKTWREEFSPQGVKFIEIQDRQLIVKVLKTNNQEKLNEMGRRHLRFSDSDEDPRFSKDDPILSGGAN